VGVVVFVGKMKKITAALVLISRDMVQITKKVTATTAIFPQIARNWRAFRAVCRGRKPNKPNKSE